MIETLQTFLGWCTVINLGLAVWWFLCLVLARDLIFRIHNRFFRVSAHEFDVMHYAGLGLFKIGIMLLNLGPYIAIRLATPQ